MPATPDEPGTSRRGTTKSASAFRTISEVAEDLDVPPHVLRFWETRFSQIRPMKRGGGRRYYRPEDVDLLRGIRRLLYTDGYTIRGVQRLLKEYGSRILADDDFTLLPVQGEANGADRNSDDNSLDPVASGLGLGHGIPGTVSGEAFDPMENAATRRQRLLSEILNELMDLKKVLSRTLDRR